MLGCASLDGPPLPDREIVESAAALWSDEFGWSPECERLLERVQIEYVPAGTACHVEANDACSVLHPGQIYMTERGRTDERRVELIVHESAHLFLGCSGHDMDGDHAGAVWSGWVEEAAAQISGAREL